MGRKEGIETYTRSRLIGYAQLLQEIAQEYKAGQKRAGEPDEGCLTRSSLLLRAQERENQDLSWIPQNNWKIWQKRNLRDPLSVSGRRNGS